MNVLLVAEESAGVKALRTLAATRARIVAVLTAARASGAESTVAGAASALGITVMPSRAVTRADLADWIRRERVDLILNVHSLFVMHAEVVRAPRIGSFNLHPGPLPGYAGLNAPSWAIYAGERRHAVTLHWMEPGIDTGAIAYERCFDIAPGDSALAVATRCVKEGVPLLARLLEAAQHGRDAIPARPQDLVRRRYFGRGAPNGSRIAWSMPAQQIADLVRACDYAPFPSPWGQAVARLDGRPVAVTRASATRQRADAEPGTVGAVIGEGVRVAAGDRWLSVERVRSNGRPVPAATMLEPGMRLGDGS